MSNLLIDEWFLETLLVGIHIWPNSVVFTTIQNHQIAKLTTGILPNLRVIRPKI